MMIMAVWCKSTSVRLDEVDMRCDLDHILLDMGKYMRFIAFSRVRDPNKAAQNAGLMIGSR
jgi:hypothetical protein